MFLKCALCVVVLFHTAIAVDECKNGNHDCVRNRTGSEPLVVSSTRAPKQLSRKSDPLKESGSHPLLQVAQLPQKSLILGNQEAINAIINPGPSRLPHLEHFTHVDHEHVHQESRPQGLYGSPHHGLRYGPHETTVIETFETHEPVRHHPFPHPGHHQLSHHPHYPQQVHHRPPEEKSFWKQIVHRIVEKHGWDKTLAEKKKEKKNPFYIAGSVIGKFVEVITEEIIRKIGELVGDIARDVSAGGFFYFLKACLKFLHWKH